MSGLSLSLKTLAVVVLAALIQLTGLTGAARALDAAPLVNTGWLHDNLEDEDLLVLDIRSPLAKSGKDDYLKGHIPGAVWSEYPGYWRTSRGDVTGVLPSIEKLEASLSELGVHEDRTVILVPAGTSDLDFGAAARIYWTFKYLGHDKVTILNGGHAAWLAAGHAVETGEIVPEGDMFVAEPRPELLVSTDEVASLVGGNALLLDSRPQTQFNGLEKHDDATRFGHLPGATHFDQAQFYDGAANTLKPLDQLKTLAVEVAASSSDPVIAYCNTGHWAATNWFVLTELLGYENVAVYDDSMVGWSRQSDLPMISAKTATN
ncbi:sulfurtransferase [Labrenzia sp. PHM005]|uniref:sulfurtransferase n=1 Tax=Labrenzia sp. PHM005 TaxID=2590016 RepID=UPI001140297C|nr:sulfurtransferase [Labrenzia sp. PHM005]QDG77921.1 sulfurtransferase [Labrenzia sp. PHM005]